MNAKTFVLMLLLTGEQISFVLAGLALSVLPDKDILPKEDTQTSQLRDLRVEKESVQPLHEMG